jgi:hypothetical protein
MPSLSYADTLRAAPLAGPSSPSSSQDQQQRENPATLNRSASPPDAQDLSSEAQQGDFAKAGSNVRVSWSRLPLCLDGSSYVIRIWVCWGAIANRSQTISSLPSRPLLTLDRSSAITGTSLPFGTRSRSLRLELFLVTRPPPRPPALTMTTTTTPTRCPLPSTKRASNSTATLATALSTSLRPRKTPVAEEASSNDSLMGRRTSSPRERSRRGRYRRKKIRCVSKLRHQRRLLRH